MLNAAKASPFAYSGFNVSLAPRQVAAGRYE
jgi:hypothetical protein